jgi:hypothetical protein
VGGAISQELRPLGQVAEGQREVELGAQVQVGGAEALAGNERAAGQCLCQRVLGQLRVAVADETLLLGFVLLAEIVLGDV